MFGERRANQKPESDEGSARRDSDTLGDKKVRITYKDLKPTSLLQAHDQGNI